MAEFVIKGGATLRTATPDEVRTIMREETAALMAAARGFKVMDLPMLRGTIANSAVTLGPQKNQLCGPASGYAWSVMALVVNGLAAGSTPDVLNFYKNDTGQPVWWQLNGNQFGETFGKLNRVLYSGESLAAANSGSLTATGTVTVTGTVIEVPQEQLYKLV